MSRTFGRWLEALEGDEGAINRHHRSRLINRLQSQNGEVVPMMTNGHLLSREGCRQDSKWNMQRRGDSCVSGTGKT